MFSHYNRAPKAQSRTKYIVSGTVRLAILEVKLHYISLLRRCIHDLPLDHSLRINNRGDNEVHSTVKCLDSALYQQGRRTWYTRIPTNAVKMYNTTLRARLLWMAVPLIYRSNRCPVMSRTNGAGNSMTRARVESKSVKIWRSGISTMMATNGRELAPGLDDQPRPISCARDTYIIPAGPRVPPLHNRRYSKGREMS